MLTPSSVQVVLVLASSCETCCCCGCGWRNGLFRSNPSSTMEPLMAFPYIKVISRSMRGGRILRAMDRASAYDSAQLVL